MRMLASGITLVGAAASTARSQNLYERLVIPGPVVDGHANLEKDCGNCYEPFSRRSLTPLCLACHKEIDADRLSCKKFHGRQSDAAKAECMHCHSDHKGRDVDIVKLDRETFDHAFTNYELRDSLKGVLRSGCHAQTVKFRDTPGRWAPSAKLATMRTSGARFASTIIKQRNFHSEAPCKNEV